MKQVILAIVVSAALVSCGGSTTPPATLDTVVQDTVIKQDTVVVDDTVAVKVDSVTTN